MPTKCILCPSECNGRLLTPFPPPLAVAEMTSNTLEEDYLFLYALARQAGVSDWEMGSANIVFVPRRAAYEAYVDGMTTDQKQRFVRAHLALFSCIEELYVFDAKGGPGIRTFDGTVHRVDTIPGLADKPMHVASHPMGPSTPPAASATGGNAVGIASIVVRMLTGINSVEGIPICNASVDAYKEDDVNNEAKQNSLSCYLHLGCGHLTSAWMPDELADELVYDKTPVPGVGVSAFGAKGSKLCLVEASLYGDATRSPILPSPAPSYHSNANWLARIRFGYTYMKDPILTRNFTHFRDNGVPAGSNVLTSLVMLMPRSSEDIVLDGNWYYWSYTRNKARPNAELKKTFVNLFKIAVIPPQLISRQMTEAKTDQEKDEIRAAARECLDAYGGSADNQYYVVFHLKDASGKPLAWTESKTFVLRNSQNMLSTGEKRKRNEFLKQHNCSTGCNAGRSLRGEEEEEDEAGEEDEE